MKKLNIAQASGKNIPRLLLTASCLLLIFNIVGASQTAVKYQSGDEPVKAVSFNIGDKTYEFDTEFKADDWLKQFSVNIRNTFSKDVTYIDVGVIAERSPEQKGEMVCRYNITKGSRSAALLRKDSGLLLKAKEPDAKLLNMRRTEAEYFQDREYLDRYGYPATIHGLRALILEVIFSDGTMWSQGRWYKADPDDTAKLLRIDKDGKVIPLTVNVQAQEGSPLRINVTNVDSSAGLHHEIKYLVQNVSTKKVAAYGVYGPNLGTHTMYPTEPYEPGHISEGGDHVEDVNLRDGRIISLEVDLVLFADGTTWGEDKGKNSDRVFGVIEGRNAAVARARQLFRNSENRTLLEGLNIEHTKTNADLGKENEKRGYGFGLGYRSTFSRLIRAFEGSGALGFEKQLAKFEASRIDIKGNQK